MAAKRDNKLRRRPFIWITWLTKLLAGENKCWWATWFRATHDYQKTPDDPGREAFFKEWTAKHDAIVNRHAATLRANGYTLKMEEDASFFAHGAVADVSGKPDIVAMKDGRAVVIDGKAGRKRKSDHWQVLLYELLLPLTWLKGHVIEGQVLYSDGPVEVRKLGQTERDEIVAAIKRVSNPEAPPHRTPSPNECRYCDVAACDQRWKEDPDKEGDASQLF